MFQQRIMFLDAFITYLRVERNCSSHTLKAYATDIRMFREYLSGVSEELSLKNCDKDLVRCWVADLMDKGCAVNSVCRKLSSLRAFFSYMKEMGEISENPAVSVVAPKKRRALPVFVKEEEMNGLLDDELSSDEASDFIYIRNKTIVACFYEMGLRLSELCGLNLADVDRCENQVKVRGKRGKERFVPFGSGLRRMLDEYMAFRADVAGMDEEALFVSSRGGRISASQVYRLVRGLLSQVSTVKRKGPHTLRHTFATVMLNNDAELGAVKELLGHEQLATTEVYTHVSFEELKRVYKKAHPRA